MIQVTLAPTVIMIAVNGGPREPREGLRLVGSDIGLHVTKDADVSVDHIPSGRRISGVFPNLAAAVHFAFELNKILRSDGEHDPSWTVSGAVDEVAELRSRAIYPRG